MKKAEYESRGPVAHASIRAVSFPEPYLGEGQVLLEVLASPINPSDVLTLTGEYGVLPPLPAVGGNEGVGRVVKHGPGVTRPPLGQTVLLPVGGGTWATHMVARADKLIPLPNEADPLQLAMLTVNPPTASLLLSEFVKLQYGDWVIQNAANSGVGAYVIQLARLRGFKTVNVVRRESALEDVDASGGEYMLVDGDDLAARVAELTGGAKIRLAIDAVGGAATGRLAECLVRGGIVVNYGATSGEPCKVSPNSLIFRDITLRGFWLAHWFQHAAPAEQSRVFGEVAQLIAGGKLLARIETTYDIDHIKEAVAAAAKGERTGKILLVPNS